MSTETPLRPVGFVKHNGAGEIVFRQAGHPSYNRALSDDGWTPVTIAPLVLPTPPEGAAAGEGDGGLSPASPAGHSKNRGGRP